MRAPRAMRSRVMRRACAPSAVAAMPQIVDFLPDRDGWIGYVRAMRVIVIVYDGVQTLDAAGPAEGFAAADRMRRPQRPQYELGFASGGGAGGPAEVCAAADRMRRPQRPQYELVFASVGGGERTMSSSLVIRTRDLRRV